MLGRSSFAWSLGLAAASALLAVDAPDARACGGCMHEGPPPGPTEVDGTVVTDHRMVFALTPSQTVLWDQVRYTGSPKDFAWVLPVKAGARIELSHDAWIAALDANTQTVITGPQASCFSSPPTEYTGSGPSGGCGFGATSESSAGGFAAGPVGADAGEGPDASVTVVSEETVGPYDAVTVRSSQGEALGDWLRANGYVIPATVQPIIDAFTTEGFDFIALRLAPGEGVQAMQPVRVVTPGADPTLPLRMIAAGAGANVGLDLYVLSEGRYHAQNFPDEEIDFSKLAWDGAAKRSNYTELEAAALAQDGGTGWVTLFAGPAALYGSFTSNPGLLSAYTTTCVPTTLLPAPGCGSTGGGQGQDASADGAAASDGGASATDSGASPTVDGGAGEDGSATPTDDGGAPEDGGGAAGDGAVAEAGHTGAEGGLASGDGGSPGIGGDAGSCQPLTIPCDDLDLVLGSVPPGNLYITRLRSKLPSTALGQDLVLEAAPSQAPVTAAHTTNVYTDPSYNPCATSSKSSAGSGGSNNANNGSCACRTEGASGLRSTDTIIAAVALAAAFGVARRRRRRGAPPPAAVR